MYEMLIMFIDNQWHLIFDQKDYGNIRYNIQLPCIGGNDVRVEINALGAKKKPPYYEILRYIKILNPRTVISTKDVVETLKPAFASYWKCKTCGHRMGMNFEIEKEI